MGKITQFAFNSKPKAAVASDSYRAPEGSLHAAPVQQFLGIVEGCGGPHPAGAAWRGGPGGRGLFLSLNVSRLQALASLAPERDGVAL